MRAKEQELQGDLEEAVRWYRRAERAGYTEANEAEEEEAEQTVKDLTLDEFETVKLRNNVIVIGIAGATRSGKSTLATLLSSFLNSDDESVTSEDNHKLAVARAREWYRNRSTTSASASFVVSGDQYWNSTNMPHYEPLNVKNWEVPEAVDYRRLNKAIDSAVVSSKRSGSGESRLSSDHLPVVTFVMVESFLLFANPSTRNRCDLCFFITRPKAVCYQRRYNRPSPSSIGRRVDLHQRCSLNARERSSC